MISRFSPWRKLLSLVAVLGFFGQLTASAQDVLILKNGQRREGEVLGVSGNSVSFKVGPAQSSIPLDQIESATVREPEALSKAQQTMASGNAAQALVEVRPIVQKYSGLPVAWVGQAYALYGDALLQLNQLDEAQKVLADFVKLYPEAQNLAGVSLARIDVAEGNFAEARKRLEPVIAEAEKVKAADSTKSATYGRAFLMMGQVRESEGQLPEALQDYLTTVTVFYADAAAVAEAQSRADALTKEKNVIAP